jgi:hypothetical protein
MRLTVVQADVPVELNPRTPQGRWLRCSVSAEGILRGRSDERCVGLCAAGAADPSAVVTDAAVDIRRWIVRQGGVCGWRNMSATVSAMLAHPLTETRRPALAHTSELAMPGACIVAMAAAPPQASGRQPRRRPMRRIPLLISRVLSYLPLAPSPQINQRLTDPGEVGLDVRVGTQIVVDVTENLVVWEPMKTGEEVVDIGVAEPLIGGRRGDTS